jgi:hypothetical protein
VEGDPFHGPLQVLSLVDGCGHGVTGGHLSGTIKQRIHPAMRKALEVERGTFYSACPGEKTQFEDAPMKTRNPVARYGHQFNKAAVHTDRKKAARRGYLKHKARPERAYCWMTIYLARWDGEPIQRAWLPSVYSRAIDVQGVMTCQENR